MKTRMPTPAEFDVAHRALVAAGWEFRLTLMADDARKPGVTNFGKLFRRGDQEFWLNFKTLAALPV